METTFDEHDLSPDACARCQRPKQICVCDRITGKTATRVAVRILQHPQEQDVELGSARLVEQLLDDARVVVGLSWGSLSHALGEEARSREWAVVYPSQLPRALSPKELAAPFVLFDREGKQLLAEKIKGLVVLDGTWSQAKALWWRNPWLLRLSRIVLHPREPSIYGKLRKEPRREYLSTLESVADALVGLGEPAETRETMRKTFRTMVQRARDARRFVEPAGEEAAIYEQPGAAPAGEVEGPESSAKTAKLAKVDRRRGKPARPGTPGRSSKPAKPGKHGKSGKAASTANRGKPAMHAGRKEREMPAGEAKAEMREKPPRESAGSGAERAKAPTAWPLRKPKVKPATPSE